MASPDLASRVGWKVSAALVIAMEIGLAFTVRDNLTLNVVMLVHPPAAVRAWQEAGPPSRAPPSRSLSRARCERESADYFPSGGCQSSMRLPSGSITQPNLPYSPS